MRPEGTTSKPANQRPTFLMCPPTLYDVNYVINPWMAGNVHRSSREHAAAQWQQLHSALTRIAHVLLVEPQPGSPDMVFTANAGLVRDGIVALSSFHHPERQGEEPHFRRWFHESGFAISEIPRATPFEAKATRSLRPMARASGPATDCARSKTATATSPGYGISKLSRCDWSTLASITSIPASVRSRMATSCTTPLPSTPHRNRKSKRATPSRKESASLKPTPCASPAMP